MRIEASSGVRGVLFRADTRTPVRFVRWYDAESGEFEAFRMDPEIARARGIPLRSLLYRGRCRLEFVPAQPLDPKPAGRIAPSTPLDEIRREVLKGGELKVRPIVWLPGQRPPECEERLCHRPAEWAVSVEQLVEPERGEDGNLYERAVMVAAHCFCSWHFRNPRQLSTRGVEYELEVKVRPQ